MVRRSRRRRAAPVVACLAVLPTACGDGGDDTGCGPTTRERLDPAYLVHVLGEEDLDYTSDPPTSGPHLPAPGVEGVVGEPLSPPVQVGILERGDVLIQHDPELSDDDRSALEDLAGDDVVVAPNPDLPASVVATAWLFKRTCDGLDLAAVEEFISERAGKGPEQ